MKLPSGLVVLFAVLTTSLGLNVVLGLKVRQSDAAARLSGGLAGVQEGVNLAGIPLRDINGQSRRFVFAGRRPTVLYIFAPTCKYCVMNLPNIRAVEQMTKESYDFIAVSNTAVGFAAYVKASELRMTHYVLDTDHLEDANSASKAAFGATPQLVVLSPTGDVKKVWVGALQEAAQSEVEHWFGVKLPGLASLGPAGS